MKETGLTSRFLKRQMNYRNRALLDLAHKLHDCPLCQRYSIDGLEPAHSNQGKHGKGMSIKASDNFHAAVCHDCHMLLDNGMLNREDAKDMWVMAYDATMLEYFKRGWLRVDNSVRQSMADEQMAVQYIAKDVDKNR